MNPPLGFANFLTEFIYAIGRKKFGKNIPSSQFIAGRPPLRVPIHDHAVGDSAPRYHNPLRQTASTESSALSTSGVSEIVYLPHYPTQALPDLLPITSLSQMFEWYRINLCGKELIDPRGQRVRFLETDFVHLIKLTDKFGREPRNRAMTIEQIQSGRIVLRPDRMDIQRAQELTWARSIVETPTMIVPNWQPLGRANPGDAYIKNFGTPEAPIYRVLVCGHAGMKRWVVTIFPKERFSPRQIASVLWP